MSTEVNHPVDLDFVLSFAMRWGEAWATRDAAGLAALCTEDIEVTDPALGTHSGPIEPPGIPPTNRAFVIDGVDHWTFRDGLVSRCRTYWDLNDFLRQLGLAPSPL